LPAAVISLMTLAVVAIGIFVAVSKYRGDQLAQAPEKVSALTRAARRDLFQDDFNETVFMRPGQSAVKNILNIDYLVIDGLVRAVGSVSLTAGSRLRSFQNGYVRSYALLMFVGALALIAAIWVVTA